MEDGSKPGGKHGYFGCVLMAIGVLILSFFIIRYYHPENNPMGIGADAYEYWDISTSILRHRELSYPSFKSYLFTFDPRCIADTSYGSGSIPVVARLPLYPMLLAAVRMLFDTPLAGIFLNVLAYIGIGVYSMQLAETWIDHKHWKNVYCILSVLSPIYFIRWGIGTDMVTSLFFIGYACHLYALVLCPGREKLNSLMSLIWGAGAILIRPNGMLYVFALPVILLMLARKSFAPRIPYVLVLVAVMGIVLGGWLMRSKSLTGHWMITTLGGLTFLVERGLDDVPPPLPLTQWNREARGKYFRELALKGETFNQAEADLDREIGMAVRNSWRRNPGSFFKQWQTGFRTYFLMSYFEFSDLIVNAAGSARDRLAYLRNGRYVPDTAWGQSIQKIWFQVSRVFKYSLVLSLFLFPWFVLSKTGFYSTVQRRVFTGFWLGILIYSLAVCLMAGAVSDRLRMPLQPFYLFFLVVVMRETAGIVRFRHKQFLTPTLKGGNIGL